MQFFKKHKSDSTVVHNQLQKLTTVREKSMHAIFSHGTQVLGWKAIYSDYLRWPRQAVIGATSLTKPIKCFNRKFWSRLLTCASVNDLYIIDTPESLYIAAMPQGKEE